MQDEPEAAEADPALSSADTQDQGGAPAGGAPDANVQPAQEAAPSPEPEGEGKSNQTPAWVQRRIDELTRARHDEARRAEAAERERDELRRASATPQEGQPRPTTDHAGQPLTREQYEADVARQAQDLVRQRAFDEQCNNTFTAGTKEFTDFEQALSNFKLLGGLPPALIEAAHEAGDAHKILYSLGKNPDEAARIMQLSPARMGAALAKMASSPPKQPALSRAPAPISPIVNGAARDTSDPDKMTTAEWMAWREKNNSAAR